MNPIIEPVKAPWIRPGAVIHEPSKPVDDLLNEFGTRLKKRGFHVAGFTQVNSPAGDGRGDGCADRIVLRNMANGDMLTICRDSDSIELARASLRKAMRDDIDLVVISRFSALERAAESLTMVIEEGVQRGLPIITSIADRCLQKWLSFAGEDGAMVAPSTDGLWRWWGPDRLYQDLALGVAEAPVLRIVFGSRWMLIEGPRGCGVSYLPKNPKPLIDRIGSLRRSSLRQLAGLIHSWDPLEMAVGIAAVNAHYNTYNHAAQHGNGTQRFTGTSGRVVVIGAFPGLSQTLPGAQVIETDPRSGEFPAVAMDTLLPGCMTTVVSSSALINRSLPRILRLATGARVAMIGPSTPLTPRLYGYGVDTLGGLIVTDPNGLAAAIQAGALPREFTRFGRFAHIHRCSGAPPSKICDLKNGSERFRAPPPRVKLN